MSKYNFVDFFEDFRNETPFMNHIPMNETVMAICALFLMYILKNTDKIGRIGK